MRLTYSCAECNHPNKMSTLLYADRIEMAQKKGSEFELRCKQCGSSNLVHVDDVVAESDFTVLIVAILSIAAGIFSNIIFLGKRIYCNNKLHAPGHCCWSNCKT